MRNQIFYKTALSIVTFCWAALFSAAQDKTTVKATIDRSKILIGEPIRLVLEADIPEHEPIRFFQLDSIPHFEFLNLQKTDTSNTGSGTVLSRVIHITSFDSGHWVIPSFSLGENMATDTLPVDVGFSPFNPDQPYHDVKEIIEVNPEEEEKEKPKWWYFVAGAILLVLLAYLLFRKKKRPVLHESAPPPDPYKEAMLQLEKLQREKPEAKQYYSRLVDIFRVYVLEKKGIHSLQATTDDLVVQLKSLRMNKDLFEQLGQTLRRTDFVKFAKYIPTADDDRNAFDIINRSIQQIEQIQ